MNNTQFELLKINSNYEIEVEYPHRIRKIGKTKFINEWENSHGYLHVKLNRKIHSKHRIIAIQWINNDDPENKTQIDHINRIRSDNRIENLRWCSQTENNKNKNPLTRRPNEYLNEFPEQVIEISELNGHDFEELFYDILDNRIIKMMNSGRLKVIQPLLDGNTLRITLTDINGNRRKMSYEKLIRTCRRLAN